MLISLQLPSPHHFSCKIHPSKCRKIAVDGEKKGGGGEVKIVLVSITNDKLVIDKLLIQKLVIGKAMIDMVMTNKLMKDNHRSRPLIDIVYSSLR